MQEVEFLFPEGRRNWAKSKGNVADFNGGQDLEVNMLDAGGDHLEEDSDPEEDSDGEGHDEEDEGLNLGYDLFDVIYDTNYRAEEYLDVTKKIGGNLLGLPQPVIAFFISTFVKIYIVMIWFLSMVTLLVATTMAGGITAIRFVVGYLME